ncbi:hypothetical protein [Dactylosporangium sp. NPDC051484]|uniref:hypothetical protein n=1 Tax=Dactylosporangium sp. NPDC051484 TaxID=3154942 RepID=UPI00344FF2B7
MQYAVDQARTAAASLLGLEAHHDGAPWFWSDQDTLKPHMAGIGADHDDRLVLGDAETEGLRC